MILIPKIGLSFESSTQDFISVSERHSYITPKARNAEYREWEQSKDLFSKTRMDKIEGAVIHWSTPRYFRHAQSLYCHCYIAGICVNEEHHSFVEIR